MNAPSPGLPPLSIRENRRRAALLVALSLVMVVASTWVLTLGLGGANVRILGIPTPGFVVVAFGGLGILFFGGTTVMWLLRAVQPADEILRIDAGGIHGAGFGHLAWHEIESVGIVSVMGQRQIGIRARGSRPQAVGAGYNEAVMGYPIVIAQQRLNVPLEHILAAIEAHAGASAPDALGVGPPTSPG